VRVVIPAAGLGSRFAGHNFALPKELLPLGDKPLLGHALAEAARAGFEAAVVVLSPTKHQIAAFLSNSDRLPLPVDTVVQSQPLGVGEAVLRCWSGEPLAVLLPDDVVLETEHWAQLIELHNQSGAATLCVREVPPETTRRFGIAECDGDRVVGLVEKPPPGRSTSNLAIFGRYIVTEPVAAALGRSGVAGELELTYGFAAAIESSPGVRAVHFAGRIYDCGTPADYSASVAAFPRS
jgi:UTP--glucose-1-phosphate uridylyltransferase